jgi:hypothetical protein
MLLIIPIAFGISQNDVAGLFTDHEVVRIYVGYVARIYGAQFHGSRPITSMSLQEVPK